LAGPDVMAAVSVMVPANPYVGVTETDEVLPGVPCWAATLIPIRPGGKSENRLEGLAPYDQRIDPQHELVVAVGLAPVRGKKVKTVVQPRNIAVYAGPDKDRHPHRPISLSSRLSTADHFINYLLLSQRNCSMIPVGNQNV
jgi:hypothetical protein